jgi:hypothetical protein
LTLASGHQSVTSPPDDAALVSRAVDFLQRICRTERITLVAINADGRLYARTFHRDDTGGLAEWIRRRNGTHNIYFHVNPLKDGVKDRKASKADVLDVSQLHVDIDDPDGLKRSPGSTL